MGSIECSSKGGRERRAEQESTNVGVDLRNRPTGSAAKQTSKITDDGAEKIGC